MFFICLLRQASLPRIQIKNPALCAGFFACARDWIRTSTPFRAPPPQSGLSTNFNTRANRIAKVNGNPNIKKINRFL